MHVGTHTNTHTSAARTWISHPTGKSWQQGSIGGMKEPPLCSIKPVCTPGVSFRLQMSIPSVTRCKFRGWAGAGSCVLVLKCRYVVRVPLISRVS